MESDTDVLVVGAGPTGLVAAAELKKRGIRCRLVDRARERSDKSRALVVQSRSLEVLDRMGALGNLVDIGQRSLSVNVHVDGRRVASASIDDIGLEDTPFPYVLFVSQAETERVLEEHARSLGLRVERPFELVGLRDGEDAIEAELEGPGGAQTVRARYVIGADGAHSAVRRLTGLKFEGDAYPQDFALADVDVDWEHPDGGVHLFFSRRGVLAVVPMRGDGAYRFIMVRGREGDEHDPTLEEVRRRARAMAGLDLDVKNPRWLARFRLHHRGVNRYRSGRAFVAGDAAHIHSPAGGQGMNTGIQDAFNLAWKMGLVVQGRAGESLLDTYHTERHPIGQNLLRFTDRIFRIGSSDRWLPAQLRRLIIPRAIPFVFRDRRRRARAFEFVSQVGIRYDWSPIAAEPTQRGTLGRAPGAGYRAPDAPLGETSLYEQLRGAGFHLLCFSMNGAKVDRIRMGLGGMEDLVTPVFIRRSDHSGADAALIDRDGIAFERYGVRDAAHYLVRPDGYIATRAAGEDVTPIGRYLQRHFLPR